MSCSYTNRLDADIFIQLLNKSIDDSQNYFPGSFYYMDLINSKKRIDDLSDQITLISITRVFDIEKASRLYETYEDLFVNALKHKSEDLYFDVIYSMFDSLTIRLIEISKSQYIDRNKDKIITCGLNNSLFYRADTHLNDGCFFLKSMLKLTIKILNWRFYEIYIRRYR